MVFLRVVIFYTFLNVLFFTVPGIQQTIFIKTYFRRELKGHSLRGEAVAGADLENFNKGCTKKKINFLNY